MNSASEPAAVPFPDRARELGAFLRSRRSRMTPERAGLPTAPRRLATGLRRDEVAVLAGVSTTWYTYLEQGRPIRPSAELLDSLARVLALTEDERRYVHRLALGHAPGPPASERLASAQLRAIVRSIGAGPDPVYVANQHTDMLAWNAATTDWYGDFGRLPPERRWMMWWLFMEPAARERIVDWEDDARDVVARFRAAYATRPHDAEFARRVAILNGASPEFRRWWGEQHVREQRWRDRVLRAPGLGERRYQIVALRISDGEFTSAVVHLPVAPNDH